MPDKPDKNKEQKDRPSTSSGDDKGAAPEGSEEKPAAGGPSKTEIEALEAMLKKKKKKQSPDSE